MAAESTLSKETILDTAEQVLRRYGDKTNVVDVAKVLRVSHGTLYRHFASKAALLEAVTERWLHRISLPLEAISNQHDGSSPERLRIWLETLIHSKQQSAADDPELFSIYTAVTSQGTELIENHVHYLITLLSRIVEQGVIEQVFKSGEPGATARAIFMATVRFHHPAHAYEGDVVTKQHDFELVWQLILAGIVRADTKL
ncbi:TetR family transcriptional regulator [Paenibacillus sp. WQ 127069]|uniref:TetR family transcriptional regulator n=1 Tax=Paenibacillus baimaensis TaxID=2982185 RepID=A0ABT2UPL9_9BACL|nr:TetR family transcriptional regulator [Paenibacillus sp. WQ 127069]MCU6796591.1 TetR family transcriptional regulator [Paenibacillus sp. WQ 127069]